MRAACPTQVSVVEEEGPAPRSVGGFQTPVHYTRTRVTKGSTCRKASVCEGGSRQRQLLSPCTNLHGTCILPEKSLLDLHSTPVPPMCTPRQDRMSAMTMAREINIECICDVSSSTETDSVSDDSLPCLTITGRNVVYSDCNLSNVSMPSSTSASVYQDLGPSKLQYPRVIPIKSLRSRDRGRRLIPVKSLNIGGLGIPYSCEPKHASKDYRPGKIVQAGFDCFRCEHRMVAHDTHVWFESLLHASRLRGRGKDRKYSKDDISRALFPRYWSNQCLNPDLKLNPATPDPSRPPTQTPDTISGPWPGSCSHVESRDEMLSGRWSRELHPCRCKHQNQALPLAKVKSQHASKCRGYHSDTQLGLSMTILGDLWCHNDDNTAQEDGRESRSPSVSRMSHSGKTSRLSVYSKDGRVSSMEMRMKMLHGSPNNVFYELHEDEYEDDDVISPEKDDAASTLSHIARDKAAKCTDRGEQIGNKSVLPVSSSCDGSQCTNVDCISPSDVQFISFEELSQHEMHSQSVPNNTKTCEHHEKKSRLHRIAGTDGASVSDGFSPKKDALPADKSIFHSKSFPSSTCEDDRKPSERLKFRESTTMGHIVSENQESIEGHLCVSEGLKRHNVSYVNASHHMADIKIHDFTVCSKNYVRSYQKTNNGEGICAKSAGPAETIHAVHQTLTDCNTSAVQRPLPRENSQANIQKENDTNDSTHSKMESEVSKFQTVANGAVFEGVPDETKLEDIVNGCSEQACDTEENVDQDEDEEEDDDEEEDEGEETEDGEERQEDVRNHNAFLFERIRESLSRQGNVEQPYPDLPKPLGKYFCYMPMVDKRYNRWKRRKPKKRKKLPKRGKTTTSTSSESNTYGDDEKLERHSRLGRTSQNGRSSQAGFEQENGHEYVNEKSPYKGKPVQKVETRLRARTPQVDEDDIQIQKESIAKESGTVADLSTSSEDTQFQDSTEDYTDSSKSSLTSSSSTHEMDTQTRQSFTTPSPISFADVHQMSKTPAKMAPVSKLLRRRETPSCSPDDCSFISRPVSRVASIPSKNYPHSNQSLLSLSVRGPSTEKEMSGSDQMHALPRAGGRLPLLRTQRSVLARSSENILANISSNASYLSRMQRRLGWIKRGIMQNSSDNMVALPKMELNVSTEKYAMSSSQKNPKPRNSRSTSKTRSDIPRHNTASSSEKFSPLIRGQRKQSSSNKRHELKKIARYNLKYRPTCMEETDEEYQTITLKDLLTSIPEENGSNSKQKRTSSKRSKSSQKVNTFFDNEFVKGSHLHERNSCSQMDKNITSLAFTPAFTFSVYTLPKVYHNQNLQLSDIVITKHRSGF